TGHDLPGGLHVPHAAGRPARSRHRGLHPPAPVPNEPWFLLVPRGAPDARPLRRPDGTEPYGHDDLGRPGRVWRLQSACPSERTWVGQGSPGVCTAGNVAGTSFTVASSTHWRRPLSLDPLTVRCPLAAQPSG